MQTIRTEKKSERKPSILEIIVVQIMIIKNSYTMKP